MRKIIFTILFILSFTSTVLASTNKVAKVAIVGNSLASNLAYYNHIDVGEEPYCAWLTKHAVGGDGLDSHGFTTDYTFWRVGLLPAGTGIGRVASIKEDYVNYDWVILLNGTNEFHWHYGHTFIGPDEKREYYIKKTSLAYKKQLKEYLDAIKTNVIVLGIPKNEEKYKYENVWNDDMKDLCGEYDNVFYEDFPEDLEFGENDSLHYSKESNIKLYQDLKKKYKF